MIKLPENKCNNSDYLVLILLSFLLLSSCSDTNTQRDSLKKDASVTTVKQVENNNSILVESAPSQQTITRTLPFFGELHVHSQNSPDAYLTGVRVGPEDAYRYARGESINHISGVKIQNTEPLDFMAVTDHAEYLGILPALADPNGPLAHTSYAAEILSGDADRYRKATLEILYTLSGTPPKAIAELDSPEISSSIWKSYIELAEQYYEPGIFTTFVAFEWTLIPNAQNLHRNVIFKGTDVPSLPFSAFDSDKPERLWQWLDQAREKGSDVLAIPHNSNVSDGKMFELVDSWGKAFDAEYASTRMRNEPLVEVSQIKGTSETHPSLSPNDEWADFEILQELLGGSRTGKISGSYVREAYLNGIQLQQEKGFNPFQFGLIAASDSHNASVPVEENNYTGKIGNADGTAKARRGGSFISSKNSKYGASGLTGVWANENTREAIFDALKRKEVFATSGPKISIRLFAGNYPLQVSPSGFSSDTLYNNGIAMGQQLHSDSLSGKTPRLYVWAGKDSRSASLQRLQIIKGWLDGNQLREQVFDVACSDGLSPDSETHRCPDNNAQVNLEDCSLSDAGDAQLVTVWEDPIFDSSQQAFYYARVLENPSCRWTTWDALRNGWELLDDVPATLQERAWTSPIWYQPI